jgi:hypothetical protein
MAKGERISEVSALVRYDAMCRAIDAAYAVDELKAIHDKARMLEAAARVAKNLEAEMRAYEIRWRAAIKVGELSKKIEKAKTGPNNFPGYSGKTKTLEEAGISSQQASDWERLFETALGAKSVRELIDKHRPVSGDALLFIGSMRDFERRGYLARTPADFMATMTDDMLAEVYRIAPLAAAWLSTIEAPEK